MFFYFKTGHNEKLSITINVFFTETWMTFTRKIQNIQTEAH